MILKTEDKSKSEEKDLWICGKKGWELSHGKN